MAVCTVVIYSWFIFKSVATVKLFAWCSVQIVSIIFFYYTLNSQLVFSSIIGLTIFCITLTQLHVFLCRMFTWAILMVTWWLTILLSSWLLSSYLLESVLHCLGQKCIHYSYKSIQSCTYLFKCIFLFLTFHS